MHDITSQIPTTMTKALQKELTESAAKGLELSNFLRKLCSLDPMFIVVPTTLVIPTPRNFFNQDPIALEGIKSFQNDMWSMTNFRLLKLAPKVSKVYPFLPM